MTGTAALDWQARLAADGFVILPRVFTPPEITALLLEWSDLCRQRADELAVMSGDGEAVCGARNLVRVWPRVVELARTRQLRGPLLELLGARCGLVRGLFFDKPPGCGWALPWHKDYSIAVRAHGRLGRFTKPTTKAGVPHVEAPYELLSRMVTARIHLDDMTDSNGPLRVIPASHRANRTDEDEARPPVVVHCRAGDVLLMRPLLTHASSHADPGTAHHRRIVHLEFAPDYQLPDGYDWHDFVRLNDPVEPPPKAGNSSTSDEMK